MRSLTWFVKGAPRSFVVYSGIGCRCPAARIFALCDARGGVGGRVLHPGQREGQQREGAPNAPGAQALWRCHSTTRCRSARVPESFVSSGRSGGRPRPLTHPSTAPARPPSTPPAHPTFDGDPYRMAFGRVASPEGHPARGLKVFLNESSDSTVPEPGGFPAGGVCRLPRARARGARPGPLAGRQ